MSLRVLRLIAFAMALVVPLQGMAAVMGGQCMSLGHHAADAAGTAHEHAADAHEPHDHEHAPPSSGGAGGHAIHDGGEGKDPHCGPCAACCASASIAGPAGFRLLPASASTTYLVSDLPPPAFTLGGFDRPPAA